MPNVDNPASLAVNCAENIALLFLLHSVPVPPFHNPIDNPPIRQKGYTLSFTRERSLAGTLAFLSNLKDGPDHIPAVCIEETPDSASLNVLLAVNKARPGDGKEVLQSLKSGFESIFELLSRVSTGEWPTILTLWPLIRRRGRYSRRRGSGLL